MNFSWSSAKASHAGLCLIEQGDIGGWQDVEEIELGVLVHTSNQSNCSISREKVMVLLTSPVCILIKTCVQRNTYETNGVLYNHICSDFWSREGKVYPRPQLDCRKKTKNN